MTYHSAYNLDIEQLDVVVIEDSKPMQTIIRAVLATFSVARIRVFDSAEAAIDSMLSEPPNLIITDWRMQPTSGYQLLRLIRHRQMEPLCFIPIMIITAFGTRPLVDKAMRAGANMLVVKPISPAVLYDRIKQMLRDSRPMVLNASGFYGISTSKGKPTGQIGKIQTIEKARSKYRARMQRYGELQNVLERMFHEKNDSETEAKVIAEIEQEVAAAKARKLGRVVKVVPADQYRTSRDFAQVKNAV